MSEIDELERVVWGRLADCKPLDRHKLKPEVRREKFMEAKTRNTRRAGDWNRTQPSLPKFKCLEKSDP